MQRKIAQAVRIVDLSLAGLHFKLPRSLQRKWWVIALAGAWLGTPIYMAVRDPQSNHKSASRELALLTAEVSQLKTRLDTSDVERVQLKQALDTFQSATEKLSKEQSTKIANVIEKFAQETKVSGISNSRLYRRAMSLVRQLREMYARQSREDLASFDAFQISNRGATGEQLRQRALQYNEQSRSLDHSHDLDLQMHVLGEMQYLNEELRRRLSDLPAPEGEVRIALTGHLTGYQPLLETANYFEILAKQLEAKMAPQQTVVSYLCDKANCASPGAGPR
jgi:hypothetical protein